MTTQILVPDSMVAFCGERNISVEDFAQGLIDEHGRHCAERLLSGGEDEESLLFRVEVASSRFN